MRPGLRELFFASGWSWCFILTTRSARQNQSCNFLRENDRIISRSSAAGPPDTRHLPRGLGSSEEETAGKCVRETRRRNHLGRVFADLRHN